MLKFKSKRSRNLHDLKCWKMDVSLIISKQLFLSRKWNTCTEKKKRKKDMVSHLRNSINSNDSLLRSALSCTKPGCKTGGTFSPHINRETRTLYLQPGTHNWFVWHSSAQLLRANLKNVWSKKQSEWGQHLEELYVSHTPLISWFNPVAQRPIQTVLA